ncbi:MAG: GNAT family N-acetyltransferase [Alphaproteobacteria bacterium]|nr:GNAT family N-acetyltransferase [Alphaproteobacteria bacterium]
MGAVEDGAQRLRIREGSPRDALELLTLRRDVLAEGRWFIGTEVDRTLEQEIRNIAALKASLTQALLVARLDGRLVGMVSLTNPPFRRTQHVVKLEIMVEEASRGQGIGKALLEAALDWAEAAPVAKIGLNVFADNARALALYRSLGFAEEGRRSREYRMEDGTWRDDVLLYRFVGGEEPL